MPTCVFFFVSTVQIIFKKLISNFFVKQHRQSSLTALHREAIPAHGSLLPPSSDVNLTASHLLRHLLRNHITGLGILFYFFAVVLFPGSCRRSTQLFEADPAALLSLWTVLPRGQRKSMSLSWLHTCCYYTSGHLPNCWAFQLLLSYLVAVRSSYKPGPRHRPCTDFSLQVFSSHLSPSPPN